MGLGHAIKQAFDKYFNVLGTSFINLWIIKITNERVLFSRDVLVCTVILKW